jgi:sugar lactone lactonase YvrE
MLGIITTVLFLNLWISIQPLPARADPIAPVYTLMHFFQVSTFGALWPEIDSQGNLYVTDQDNDQISIFDPAGVSITNITGFGEPTGIATYGNRIYVSDFLTNNLTVLENNTIIDSTPITDPLGIEIGPDNNIYVTSRADDTVYIYNHNLLLLDTIHGINYATDVAIAPDGRIFVSTSLEDNVSIFSPDHTYLGYIGGTGSEPGQLNAPYGIDVNIDGYLFIADTINNRVQIFSPDNQLVNIIGVHYPLGLTTDGIGHLYVAAFTNGNVSIWETTDLGDHEGPTITAIQTTPLNPTANQPVTVTALITDLSGVTEANLTYSYPGATPTTIPMTANSDTFNATLPGLPGNVLVDFYITAEDTSLAHHRANSSTLQLNILSGPPIIPVDTGTLALTGTALGGLALVIAIIAMRRRPTKRKRK